MVQCHGHYDLLHPGHIKQLKEASQLGRLFVTLTAGRFMTKPGHPIFTDEERLEMILSLRFVEKAFLIQEAGFKQAIDLVKPDIYVKGKEYLRGYPEEEYCKEHGIEVRFIGEKIYGSTTINDQTRLLRCS